MTYNGFPTCGHCFEVLEENRRGYMCSACWSDVCPACYKAFGASQYCLNRNERPKPPEAKIVELLVNIRNESIVKGLQRLRSEFSDKKVLKSIDRMINAVHAADMANIEIDEAEEELRRSVNYPEIKIDDDAPYDYGG